MSARVLQIDPADDLIVALSDLAPGDLVQVNADAVTLEDAIPAKHKFARRHLRADEAVRMYGVVVGRVTADVPAGCRLTTSNLRHEAAPFSVRQGRSSWAAPDTSRFASATFEGIVRDDGRVGTANHWIVVPLVFCENRNVEVLRHALLEELGYEQRGAYAGHVRKLVELHRSGATPNELRAVVDSAVAAGQQQPARVFPNVDGIKFLTHGGGCGGTREDAQLLCALLAAYIDHPNVAGATVLSLGCQNAQIAMLEEELERRHSGFKKPLVILDHQQTGMEERLIREAIGRTFVGLAEANNVARRPVSLERLVIGVECGGSDGFSGISANPAIGHAADLVVALGGSAILSEFPELCGVEQEIIDRCVSIEVASRFESLQRAYAARAEAVGTSFDMNPSPGNIRDGLLTDAMKSAGAARKGGTSPVVDVLDYTEPLRRNGLTLLCTPGNDVESTTALVGSGANVILFSTGLGTPTGNPIVPVIKVSSNTRLAERMPDLIDVDAGAIVSGEEHVEEVGSRLLAYTLEVASGRITPAAVRLGQDDFLPWKRGISL